MRIHGTNFCDVESCAPPNRMAVVRDTRGGFEACLAHALLHLCRCGCNRATCYIEGCGRWQPLDESAKEILDTIWKKTQLIGCEHEWHEQPGEPPVDVCMHCGSQRS